MNKHLWEVPHPYYCSEQNYYSNHAIREFTSWKEFLEEYGNSDMDMNLVFRWDWLLADPEDVPDEDQLLIFFMGQRKGIYHSVTIKNIQPEDEPAVIAWLQLRWEHSKKLWEPFDAQEN